LLTLVDTPGADPGPDSEAGGLAGEIARTFAAMDALPTPSVSVCVGEGGSGGALAIAHADRLLIQRHAVFSVIAPEGAAAILHRDSSRAAELAEQLRLTAPALVELGVADGVVDEVLDADTLLRAFEVARAGDRRRRIDGATARWLAE
jgi:acetyl-CoA carboxylase carboxyl transferase subunit beta